MVPRVKLAGLKVAKNNHSMSIFLCSSVEMYVAFDYDRLNRKEHLDANVRKAVKPDATWVGNINYSDSF